MKTTNETLLGFESINDFMTSLVNIKYRSLTLSITFITSLSGFISKYVYDDAKAVYFLLFLILFDTLTGIYRAFRTKTFTSKRLPRMLLIMLTYCIMLSLGWNASQHSIYFGWLPSVLYGGFISTLLVSVVENLSAVGLLPSSLSKLLEDKLNFKNLIKKDEKEVDS